MPVPLHDFALLAKQVEGGVELLAIQGVGILDPYLGFVGHQIERRVRHVDGTVVGLDASLVGLAVGKRLLGEHDVPALRRGLEDIGVVHQDIRSPLVRHAVVFAVDGMPGRVLQPGIDVLPTGDEFGVDLLHPFPGDQPVAGIAGGGDQVESTFVHQRNHLV